MATEITNLNPPKYGCDPCDFFTSKKTDYMRHLATQKHKFIVLATISNTKNEKNTKYECKICNKDFTDRTGLWRHNKKCNKNEQLMEEYHKKIDKLTDVVLDVVSKNSERTKQLIELSKSSGTNNSHNISNANNHNKTFNLQVFLNEECKNAINIRDFVESIQVQLSDLENTGQVGYVEGISQIFIDNLSKINKHDRPIHCSDYKRETLYIKNNNEWNKEGDDKALLTNAIKHVAHKNMKQISIWAKDHPSYNDPTSKENDKYLQIVSESMPGLTAEETNKNYNKIIKNIVKETVIEK